MIAAQWQGEADSSIFAKMKGKGVFTRQRSPLGGNMQNTPYFIETGARGCYLQCRSGTGARGRCTSQEDDELSISASAATAADTKVPRAAPTDSATSEEQLALIMKSLDDDKAEEPVQIDLRGKSAIGDYMIVCSGRSSRQVSAIADKLVDRLKHDLGRATRVEGRETGDWVLIDTGDIIVHVFRPEVRDFYQLEKMWLPIGGTASGSAAPA